MSGNNMLSTSAQTKAMTMRMSPMVQKEDPVLRFTAHSIGRAWHRAIISAKMEACFMVSGMAIMTAMPA